MTITQQHSDQQDRAAEARALLEGQRRRRADEIAKLEVHVYDMRIAMARASADGSLVDVELLENRLSTARRALVEVDEALKRLSDGSYGRCADCEGTIAPERLEVLPEARLCTPCKAASGSSRR
jgi:RNA polymerase-binding transcription factor DksA